ncbi:MAG: methyltransferase domain-containing protein [Spirochaetes bacterium]|nr:methyltransferase domain-containing protein [Spirochaetota bacterium]
MKLNTAVEKRLDRIFFGSILRVGCGSGGTISMIEQGGNGRSSGIDVLARPVRDGQGPPGSGTVPDLPNAASLPCKRGSFDVVACTDAFRRFRYASELLQEIHRVLKPFGRLVLADKIHPFVFFRFPNMLLHFVWSGERKPCTRKRYTKKEIISLAVLSGFAVSDFILVGRHDFVMTAVAL